MKDGMSDEQICGNCFNREGEHTAEDQCIDDRGHLLGTEWKPIRSATNEELIEQGQNLAKNYKPGPRQAVPFMPQPVEERTAAPLFNDSAHMIGAILDRIDMAPNDDPIPYIREYVDGLRERNCIAERPMQTPIPEERTAEMEQPAEVLHCDNGDYMVYIPCGIEIAHCRDEKIANWIRDKWNADHIEGKGK